MEIGGAERALLGLLEAIDKEQYDVDLFLMRHNGELLKYVPNAVHIMPEKKPYDCLAIPIVQVLKQRQFRLAIGRLIGKHRATNRVKKLNLNDQNDVALEFSHKYTLPCMPLISEKEYDLAVSFLTPHYFVAKKVKAQKKVAWIHTDYSTIQVDVQSQFPMWDAYDRIISISEACTASFMKVFPILENKIDLIENIQPVDMILKQADEFEVGWEMPDDGTIKILSVGRFSNAKNFDNVPDICRRILKKGVDIRWYLIGYGGDEPLIRQRISEAGMEDRVIILGKKENPYPYMKSCDLYVQPSRYEGNCVCVHEAQLLNKPVVISRYPTSGSQLRDGIDGIIVSMDNEGCAEGIYSVLKNQALRDKLIQGTQQYDYSNRQEVEKLLKLIPVKTRT